MEKSRIPRSREARRPRPTLLGSDPEAAMTDNAGRIESLFAAAVAMPMTGDRVAFLDKECAGDPALREQLEALLQAHQQSSHLLDRPAAASWDDTGPLLRLGEPANSVIAGRYKLL